MNITMLAIIKGQEGGGEFSRRMKGVQPLRMYLFVINVNNCKNYSFGIVVILSMHFNFDPSFSVLLSKRPLKTTYSLKITGSRRQTLTGFSFSLNITLY